MSHLHTVSLNRGNRWRRWIILVLFTIAAAVGLAYEARTSTVQSLVLTGIGRGLTYHLAEGPSDSVAFPAEGPYPQRRGFVLIPAITDALPEQGFRVARQARISPGMLRLHALGIPLIYHERPEESLELLDRHGNPIYAVSYPERVYATYDSIPDIVVETLLFIENRELGSRERPYKNPAVEWDRLVKAVIDQLLGEVVPGHQQTGGSTLATQIEKFRHSPQGRTSSAAEKLRQMAAASLRSYIDGRNTLDRRLDIVLEYVNAVPLAAAPGYGEVSGIGDGLWAWYGLEFEDVNRTLRHVTGLESEPSPEVARTFKHVLSLFVAQRRPTVYLLSNPGLLERATDSHARLLARAGVLSPGFRDAVLEANLEFRQAPAVTPRPSYIDHKATNSIRTRIMDLLGLEQLYDLDRIDLTAVTTLDEPVNRDLTRTLVRLREKAVADSMRLCGKRLLESGDPAGVVYSFTLYEATSRGNLLRVQADNFDQPLDINEGVKLDLGSTAKLRTLVTYLEVVADLHRANAGRERGVLRAKRAIAVDPIRRWAFDYLASASDTTLAAMLEAAMNRRYSGNPWEKFFTGGWFHHFENFDEDEDKLDYTVATGFRHSVNLVFIRLMRDLVQYYQYELPGVDRDLFDDPEQPARATYLRRFADREGREFLSRFHRKYRELDPDACLEAISARARTTLSSQAAVYRYLHPEAGPDSLASFLLRRFSAEWLGERVIDRLYREQAPEAFDLHDRAYIARVHPLELWVAKVLHDHPHASWDEVVEAGAEARQEAYKWLFTTKSLKKQNRRIRILVEEDAFRLIHASWARLGYPFDSLVSSYATAIGSSADRPAALAELVGIIVNDGVRVPARRLTELRFAEGTPFETVLECEEGLLGERVLPPEVAHRVRTALIDVVENGTARRARGAFRLADGTPILLGGKTGTGDHRFERYSRHGELIESRVVSRSGTFAFVLGDRFFGTVTVYVHGPEAEGYSFTSSLPVALLAALEPVLRPLVTEGAEGECLVASASPAAERPQGAADPVDHQEVESSDQERHAAHHRVAEGGSEAEHQEPDAKAAHAADRSGVLDREEEVDEHRDDAGEDDQAVEGGEPASAVAGQVDHGGGGLWEYFSLELLDHVDPDVVPDVDGER